MEKILKERSGQKKLSDITNADLSALNLTSLDADILAKCIHLYSLNLSKNQLKDLSCLEFTELKTLNIEHNCITNLKFLSRLPSLETLYIDGNPLSVADRYIAVDQLPNLQVLDGKSCIDIRKITGEFDEKLNVQGVTLYETKYETIVKACVNVEDINRCQKQFSRDLLNKVSPGSKAPPSYIRYKVQDFSENIFTDFIASVTDDLYKLEISNSKVNKTPVKSSTDSCKIVGTPKKMDLGKTVETPKKTKLANGHDYIDCLSPSKRRKSRNDKQFLEYDPRLILRIHSNDPQDADTPVWCAAFEPDISDEKKNTDMAATCGGSIVSFLNYKTGHVLMKYKCESENFYTLDWSILTAGENGKAKVTVLAVGGNGKSVHLIIPSWKICYTSFKAHTQAIDAVHFHPVHKTWLFSGGKDKVIHLWDIGSLSIPNLEKSHQKKLMSFEAGAEVFRILFSPSHNLMFAATDNGLLSWNLNGDITSWTRNPSTILTIPEDCKPDGGKAIDGMVFVSEKIMAVKVCKSDKILLWNISTISSDKKTKRQKTCEISPIATFLWNQSNVDYIYIDCCQEAGLLASGDDAGRLWLYNVDAFKKDVPQGVITDVQLPNVVFPWPKLIFEKEDLNVRSKVIINSVKFNWNGEYLITCTDSNLLCIWKKM